MARSRLRFNAATTSWNAVEGTVAVAAGVAAGSVGLVGFGFDPAIEVSAALVSVFAETPEVAWTVLAAGRFVAVG